VKQKFKFISGPMGVVRVIGGEGADFVC